MMVNMVVVVRERRGIFASFNIFHFRIHDQTCFPRFRSHTLGLDDEDAVEVLLFAALKKASNRELCACLRDLTSSQIRL